MQSYALIALDMDGTLLNSELKLTPGTCDAVHRASEAGKEIVISTGRCLAEIRDTLKQLPEIRYLVCESGSCVYDTRYDQTIQVDPVPKEEIEYILQLVKGERVTIQVFNENQSYVNRANDEWMPAFRVGNYRETFNRCAVWDVRLFDRFAQHPFRIEKINLYFDSESARRRIAAQLEKRHLKLADSIGYMIEVISGDADKGRGLAGLCAHLGVPMEATIAVGDSLNDIEILQCAGFSAAMGNACKEAKAAADFVTDDCDHDGVARVIDAYLLK